jgi:hypothetical protein
MKNLPDFSRNSQGSLPGNIHLPSNVNNTGQNTGQVFLINFQILPMIIIWLIPWLKSRSKTRVLKGKLADPLDMMIYFLYTQVSRSKICLVCQVILTDIPR